MQGRTATTRKISAKTLKHTENKKICLERTFSSKMSVNSRPKAPYIIGQRKAFYRQRIPSCLAV